jgi:hypothetical protein
LRSFFDTTVSSPLERGEISIANQGCVGIAITLTPFLDAIVCPYSKNEWYKSHYPNARWKRYFPDEGLGFVGALACP